MTRKVRIGTQNVSLSKTEAKEVQRLCSVYPAGNQRDMKLKEWAHNAPTPEARTRRTQANAALGIV